MAREGFDIQVTSPGGTTFRRKSRDDIPADGPKPRERIPFKFDFDETLRPNFGRVTIVNMKPKYRKEFEKGKKVTIQAGHLPEQENNQFILDADIINTRTYDVRDRGKTHDTDIMFRDTPAEYHTHQVARKWSRGTPVTTVLKDLVKDEIGADIGKWNAPSSGKKYRRGKSFYLPALQAVRQVASDIKGNLFFYNKQAYLVPANESLPGNVTISEKDMKNLPFDKAGVSYEARVDFKTDIKPSHDIQVQTEELSGKFRVYSGKHTSIDGYNFHSIVRFK